MVVDELDQFLYIEHDTITLELVKYLVDLLPIEPALNVFLPVKIQQEVTDAFQPICDENGLDQGDWFLVPRCQDEYFNFVQYFIEEVLISRCVCEPLCPFWFHLIEQRGEVNQLNFLLKSVHY